MTLQVLLDLDSAEAVLGFSCCGVLQQNGYSCIIAPEVLEVLYARGGEMTQALSQAIEAKQVAELSFLDSAELDVFTSLAQTRRLTSLECAIVATAIANQMDLLVRDEEPVLRAMSSLDYVHSVTVHSLSQVLRSIASASNCPTARAAYARLELG
jgi:hypothetical protein